MILNLNSDSRAIMQTIDEKDTLYMQRAIELAKLGMRHASPNPMVGCVIVENDEIIGEGWHQKFGEAHAEVNAVRAAQDKSRLKKSTVYVTLEPCSHFGKTPPCADMLIAEGVKKVVVAVLDPNPLVAGKGISKLKDAGIEVVTGVLEAESREMNKRFLTFFEKQRPYIILKWAETTDGFIARDNYDSKWISDEYSRLLVHKWRSEEDSILVGSDTVKYDNPQLTVRQWTGRNPLRIVLDRFLKLSGDFHIFNDSQTLVYNTVRDSEERQCHFVRVEENNFIQHVVKDLHKRKIQSVLIEGGSQILNSFISAGLWDEARVFVSPVLFERGIPAPQITQLPRKADKLDNDVLKLFFNSQPAHF
jgi:diaminohydroxyphosphoribosylaminopyrimidine deaminase / 5-amino-6-(5-phosphoribosylamino)uracil reductase